MKGGLPGNVIDETAINPQGKHVYVEFVTQRKCRVLGCTSNASE